MSLTTDLTAYLSTHPALVAFQGERVYPLGLPQEPTLPATTYAQVSAAPEQDHGNKTLFERRRYQFDLYGSTYLGAHALAEALRAELADWPDYRAVFETQQDLSEPELGRYRISMDYFIEIE